MWSLSYMHVDVRTTLMGPFGDRMAQPQRDNLDGALWGPDGSTLLGPPWGPLWGGPFGPTSQVLFLEARVGLDWGGGRGLGGPLT